MDGAEKNRRCKEWSDVNNLGAAVQWTQEHVERWRNEGIGIKREEEIK